MDLPGHLFSQQAAAVAGAVVVEAPEEVSEDLVVEALVAVAQVEAGKQFFNNYYNPANAGFVLYRNENNFS